MKKTLVLLIGFGLALNAFAVKPDVYSDQLTLLRGGDSVARADSGQVVVQYFSHTLTALVAGKTIALVRIPAGSRILGGAITSDDMGGAEVLDLGLIGVNGNGYINDGSSTADDVDLFLNGVADPSGGFDSGGASGGIGEDSATYAAYDKDVYLSVTNPSGGATWVAGKIFTGWVMYIK